MSLADRVLVTGGAHEQEVRDGLFLIVNSCPDALTAELTFVWRDGAEADLAQSFCDWMKETLPLWIQSAKVMIDPDTNEPVVIVRLRHSHTMPIPQSKYISELARIFIAAETSCWVHDVIVLQENQLLVPLCFRVGGWNNHLSVALPGFLTLKQPRKLAVEYDDETLRAQAFLQQVLATSLDAFEHLQNVRVDTTEASDLSVDVYFDRRYDIGAEVLRQVDAVVTQTLRHHAVAPESQELVFMSMSEYYDDPDYPPELRIPGE